MTDLTTGRLAEIRREAEGALNIWDGYSWRPSATTVARADGDILTTPYPVVARFCEQADPPTVLALLDEVEQLRKFVEQVETLRQERRLRYFRLFQFMARHRRVFPAWFYYWLLDRLTDNDGWRPLGYREGKR